MENPGASEKKSIFSNLTVQVLIAIVLGIIVGALFPAFASTAKLISEVFINLIRMVVAPIIFFTVVIGIAGVGSLKKLGRVGGKALLYFEVITTLALVIGLIVANVIRPGDGVEFTAAASEAASQYEKQAQGVNWGEFFSHLVPHNAIGAFAQGDILQVLVFSVLFGVAVTRLGKTGEAITGMFDKVLKVFFEIMRMVMKLAPLGAFGGIAFTVGNYGFAALLPLARLMGSVYATMFIFIFGVLGLVGYLYKFSVWGLIKYIRNELLIVLGTSSSEAALPLVIKRLEQYGCSKPVTGLVIPAGYSFNLDGTTIYLSMAIIFLAQVFNVPLTFWDQASIIGVLMITSKGAAAITGGGFIVLASTLSAYPAIPVEGLTLLIGVDRFMSEARAITNLIGNSVATVVVAKSENEFHPPARETLVNEAGQ
ncbi:MAG: C4-dicarboxylate transporter DctA [Cyclobacteriaceae bacterium]|nr:C4-dicarboxylate transporter DctA [Cyclobacteriaceae bacterium]